MQLSGSKSKSISANADTGHEAKIAAALKALGDPATGALDRLGAAMATDRAAQKLGFRVARYGDKWKYEFLGPRGEVASTRPCPEMVAALWVVLVDLLSEVSRTYVQQGNELAGMTALYQQALARAEGAEQIGAHRSRQIEDLNDKWSALAETRYTEGHTAGLATGRAERRGLRGLFRGR